MVIPWLDVLKHHDVVIYVKHEFKIFFFAVLINFIYLFF